MCYTDYSRDATNAWWCEEINYGVLNGNNLFHPNTQS
jgi:hypothetical protein